MRILPYSLLLLLLAVVSGAASTCELSLGPGIPATQSSFFAGMPLATDLTSQSTAVLENIGFTVGYSDTYKNPLWVCYRLFATCPCEPRNRDGIGFRNDPRTHTSVPDNFNWAVTDMDRGHHAPNSAISTCYGTQAQEETYLLSNISPQHKDLNQRIWKYLEDLVLDYANAFGEVWVITGAIIDPESVNFLDAPVPNDSKPAVPDAFYKIIIRETSSGLGVDTLSFIFPNKVPDHSALEDYLRSIEEIQLQTGLDFLWQLDEATEKTVEATPAPALWDTSQVTPSGAVACASIVSINEFEANPSDSDTGHEWVELYNAGPGDVSIGGWTLQTVTGTVVSLPLPAGATIPANGFYVFDDPALRLTNAF
ncbi:MAG: DNA/RNA non-specific endonuclease, partial [Dehalococcoidia bacterium]|nr:DNA/RNA non-specific endonuclease [Dehalococcoidia bacterium]